MTVSTTIIKNSHNGNGSTTNFAYQFKILQDSDLVVIIRSSTGTETTKTLTTHYTVAGAGDASGGSITFTAGNTPASGETVVIRRNVPQTQAIDYIANDPFPAETHEEGLDRTTMIAQQVSEEADRSIKLSRTNTMASTEFTVGATDRANKVLSFDSSGEISVTQELGTYKGTDATTTTAAYVIRDIVKSTTAGQLNNVYICIQNSPAGTALTNTAYWSLLVDAVSAGTSATSAAGSATAAANSATASANSATASANSASAASTSETNAANSASTSSTQATNSANSATASANSAAAAEATFDLFDDSYLGSKSSDPSVDNDGNALKDGALYFNTTDNVMKVYDLGTTTWFQLTPTVSNQTNINTVAGIASDVTTVSNINLAVTNVSSISPAVSGVNSNSSNINTVSGISGDVTAVANISSDVQAVENIKANVTTVAGISSDVTGVANISTAVSNVNSNSSNINAVNSNSSNITTVAGISADVTSVAGDATDIGTVATDLAGSNNIGTVAGSITNVNNVGGSIANVNSVAGNLASVNNFGEVYRIASSAPTTSLNSGDLYFNTSTNVLNVYGASGWQNAGSSVNGTSQRYNYTATNAQTTFTGADNNGNTLAYDAGYIDVYLNGVKLLNGTDVTVTSGSSVVLASGATTGDVVDIVAYGTFSVASLNADNLDSGTVPDARITGTYTGITGLDLTDNSKIRLGTGNDLEIFHNGTNSYISDNGTGDLYIRGSADIRFTNPSATENYAIFNDNGAVDLYYDNAKKFETTSTGALVTGRLSTSAGNASEPNFNFSADGNTGIYRASQDVIAFSNNGSESMRIDSSGNVGIGTSTPTARFDTRISTTTGKVAEFHNSSGYGIDFTVESNSGVNTISSGTTQALAFATNSSSNERMRIDSSGNIQIAKTARADNTVGHSLQADGLTVHTRDGAELLFLNRKTSDGKIVSLRKDNTEIGQIGSREGRMYLYSPSPTGSGLRMGDAFVMPCDSDGSDSDNDTALGQANSRFTDLYLSGGLYVGGTGTANKLDDYEEGTWTPVLTTSGNTDYTSVGYSIQYGHYTKIGRKVIAQCRVQTNSFTQGSPSGNIRISGLPFTSATNNIFDYAGSIGFSSHVNYNLSSFGTLSTGAVVNRGTTVLSLTRTRNNNTADGIPATAITASGFDITITVSYIV